MRVLAVGNMYPPHHLGGYELVWRGAVLDLRERGHDVRVLTTDHRAESPPSGTAEDSEVFRELRWYWRDHEFPPIGLRARITLERHNRATLERHLDEFRPDVVSWWAMGGMSLALVELVRRRGIPAVGFVHDAWMLYGPKVDAWQRLMRRLGPIGPALERAVGVPARFDLGSAARWVFVSEAMRRQTASGGMRLPDSGVAHSGIEIGALPRAGAKPWHGRLMCVGRLDPRKGLLTAIEALTRLPEATLAIVGSGDDAHAAELRRAAGALGVSARVRFRSSVAREELGEVYAEADALLFPVTWDEPWGLVPLEAMAVGVPVIATGTGGSAEFLEHERNCLIFAPRGDPDALAASVARLARDTGLRDRLREAGFATAARYTDAQFNAAVVGELERASAGGA